MNKKIENLILRYPPLQGAAGDIQRSFELVAESLRRGGTLFTCGNGGSGADAEHIAGELLKGFLKKRPLDSDLARRMAAVDEDGGVLAARLQKGLRCISLLSHPALASAFGNDVDPELAFAQQLLALGRAGDVVLGISTSGNASNIRKAFVAARAAGIATVLLTGSQHGLCEKISDIVIAVPERETFKIQELHLPVYHALCAALEAEFFDE